MTRPVFSLVVTLALSTSALFAQAGTPALTVDPVTAHQPSLRLDGFFADPDLQHAVERGLPLRVRVRLELWQDRFIDQLASSQTWSAVLTYDPLDKSFRMRTVGTSTIDQRVATYADARALLEAARTFTLRPLAPGKYYFTAKVEVETLSVSDLEELEAWLKGELKPAVSGDRSVPNAIGVGAKRLLMRVLALPTKTLELETPRFRV